MLRLLLLCLLCVHVWAEPALTILLSQSPPDSGGSLQSMQDEVSRLLSPAGVSVGWIRSREHQAGHHFARLVSLTLKGDCSARPEVGSPAPLPALRTLAHTETTDGQILPFATVDCRALRQFLAPTLNGMSAPARGPLMGQALGRLVAHELYHIMLQTRHHRTRGISRACFSLRDLLAKDFSFDEWTIAQLRPAPPPVVIAVPEPLIADDALTTAEEVSARD